MTDTQAVLFDLDGTLIDFNFDAYNRALAAVTSELAREHGFDAAALQREHRNRSIERWGEVADGIFRNGLLDGPAILLEVWQESLRALGCTDSAAAHRGHDAYWQARKEIFTLFDETLEVLNVIKGRLPIAAVSNGPHGLQVDKLAITGLDRYFGAHTLVTSGGSGVAKPDPTIFRLALGRLGVDASAAWHVGDNLLADIGGANNAGLRSAWVNRTHASRPDDGPRPDAEIPTLRGLLPLLGLEDGAASLPSAG